MLATSIAVTSSFGPLLIYIGFSLNVFAALTVVSLFRLRTEGRSKPNVCVDHPVSPVAFLVFALWMTVGPTHNRWHRWPGLGRFCGGFWPTC